MCICCIEMYMDFFGSLCSQWGHGGKLTFSAIKNNICKKKVIGICFTCHIKYKNESLIGGSDLIVKAYKALVILLVLSPTQKNR